MSKYEITTEDVAADDFTTQRITVLKNADAKPKGMARVIEMEDTISKDFNQEQHV